ncbi:hypothetical protein BD410DRAFT_797485 [Rickenella mellea]|uniref:Ricin B lectin domain-containing protein n=1 Tax=Rickenella mellea TaxID=50990 RepID=A0A4Y7PEI4_9AGAM|nr:hypothetical protein BD410DRAFT_797485 [Rickenella mellea]
MYPPRTPAVTGQCVPTGRYFVRNARWKTYLELPESTDEDKVVSAVGENTVTHWWDVVEIGNGMHYILNASSRTHANCDFATKAGSAVVVGSRRQQFIITECRTEGNYTIGLTDVELYWGLSDDEFGTSVQLHPIPNTEENQWYFIPVDMKPRSKRNTN